MANIPVKVVFGGYVADCSLKQIEEYLAVLEEAGVKNIDTAQMYGDSEKLLGQVHAASRFIIDTKHVGGGIPGESSKDKVITRAKQSLEDLQTDAVDIFYIHVPDRKHPLEDTLAGINELYKAGKFKRFGLSNFHASEVEDVIRISKENNFVLPTVYQGNYSAIARRQEKELFPTLRKHNIAFYAYSPIAGGFLAKTKEQIVDPEVAGRWDRNTFMGGLYHALYNKPTLLAALDTWGQISKDSGIPRAELAYRWVAYHSAIQTELGDALIVGASRVEQLQQTLDGLKHGPLNEDVVERINGIWKDIEHEAPLDNMEALLNAQV